ncbi:Vegetative catalase [compost metagenome]
MRSDGNGGHAVYYEPNSFGGPQEAPQHKTTPFAVSGMADSTDYNQDDHYTQAGDLYRLLSEEERSRLIANIAGAMQPVEREEIKIRQVGHWFKADAEFGTRLAEALGLPSPSAAE